MPSFGAPAGAGGGAGGGGSGSSGGGANSSGSGGGPNSGLVAAQSPSPSPKPPSSLLLASGGGSDGGGDPANSYSALPSSGTALLWALVVVGVLLAFGTGTLVLCCWMRGWCCFRSLGHNNRPQKAALVGPAKVEAVDAKEAVAFGACDADGPIDVLNPMLAKRTTLQPVPTGRGASGARVSLLAGPDNGRLALAATVDQQQLHHEHRAGHLAPAALAQLRPLQQQDQQQQPQRGQQVIFGGVASASVGGVESGGDDVAVEEGGQMTNPLALRPAPLSSFGAPVLPTNAAARGQIFRQSIMPSLAAKIASSQELDAVRLKFGLARARTLEGGGGSTGAGASSAIAEDDDEEDL